MTGKKYGKLTVVEMIHNGKGKKYSCRCICECGNEIVAASMDIRNGHTKSCGCLKKFKGSRIENIKNEKFGKLTVIKFLGIENKKTKWLCRCDCGKIFS